MYFRKKNANIKFSHFFGVIPCPALFVKEVTQRTKRAPSFYTARTNTE